MEPLYWTDYWPPKLSNVLDHLDESKLHQLAVTYSQKLGRRVDLHIGKDPYKWWVTFRFGEGLNQLILYLMDDPHYDNTEDGFTLDRPTVKIADFIIPIRRQGIGSMIISLLLPCLQELGFKRVILVAGDLDVVQFWSKVGFIQKTPRRLHMYRDLVESSTI